MKSFLSVAALVAAILSVAPTAHAEDAGFQFVLVVTQKSKDVVLVNEDIPNREFKSEEMTCKTRLETKKDPVYPDQTLGIMVLECKYKEFPIQTSVTCSLLDSAAQNHFEFGTGEEKLSFDLLCKAKTR